MSRSSFISSQKGTDQNSRCRAWLDRLFIAVDANFKLSRFNVSSDISNPCLNKGYSYFIDNKRVDAHLEKFKDKVPEEVNTCNDHNAVKLATMKGGKGLAITGVGGVVCSCHECRRASSVINLTKGKQYVFQVFQGLTSIEPVNQICTDGFAHPSQFEGKRTTRSRYIL